MRLHSWHGLAWLFGIAVALNGAMWFWACIDRSARTSFRDCARVVIDSHTEAMVYVYRTRTGRWVEWTIVAKDPQPLIIPQPSIPGWSRAAGLRRGHDHSNMPDFGFEFGVGWPWVAWSGVGILDGSGWYGQPAKVVRLEGAFDIFGIVGKTRGRRTPIAPFHPLWLGLIGDLSLCTSVLWLGTLVWTRWRRLRRVDRGLCPTCGYDREGLNPAAACPECGEESRSPRRLLETLLEDANRRSRNEPQ